MTTAWFHCAAGVAGDMLLGTLIDAGADTDSMQRAVDAVVPGRVQLRTERVTRCGLSALRAHADVTAESHHRTWSTIRELLTVADLPQQVRSWAFDAFARLARAEGRVHGVPADDVHFHEVGALDAIADIVGSAMALHSLGVDRVVSSPLALGSGEVNAAHGTLPVPVPAVVQLLAEEKAPAHAGSENHEMSTPTGTAILLSVASEWGGMPSLRVVGTGTGAGSRDLARLPNVLRVVLGTPMPPARSVDSLVPVGLEGASGALVRSELVVECNVDDMDPRMWPHVLSRLLDIGASDAWLTPILMKKGRPAHSLAVLSPLDRLAAVREVILTETSTIGMRVHQVEKWEAAREFTEVMLEHVPVRVKVARYHGRVVNVQPEHDDVLAAAQALAIPLKHAHAWARAAAQAGCDEGRSHGG
ncbi:nickel pincer cofactor biosynthesis protein LarC [Streptomyces anulatus]|uniref:nickel pincer cofactor biosynthesis protein LarC n=1 Tax=Streptomyces anulatus TaxID=1892 RepID=UPI002E340676|nr:nickel pincer cofactor biosynthesis protein LarC [Streptomyces anulatus]WTD24598.1 nickel pincer cofactor biosynthesis protein LarC [Streptomyces anulatus]